MDAALKSKFEQILALDPTLDKLEDEQQVTPYLRYITGYRYRLEKTSQRRWEKEENPLEEGTFYHILPDQVDNGFYNWYSDNRPFHQLFRTPEMALLQFLFYWHAWQKEIHHQETQL